MSGRVVEFGGNAAFFKRRAAGLRADKPVEAMKFLYRALEQLPEDMEAQVAAASMALADDRPRLAIRLAAQSIPEPEAFYIVGLALMRLRFQGPAAVALMGCARQTDQKTLYEAAVQAMADLQLQSRRDNRQEERASAIQMRIRRHMIDGEYEAAAGLAQKGMVRFPESRCAQRYADILWRMGQRKSAVLAEKLGHGLLPVSGRRKKQTIWESPAQLNYLRKKMLAGEYQAVLDAPVLPGAERSYMRASALVRMGADKESYLPILLDMQAMDPDDAVVEWALQLVQEGREKEMPRLYGVTKAAARQLKDRMQAESPDRTAVRWGLSREDTVGMAIDAAHRRSDGELLLRQALSDPLLPARCRSRIAAVLQNSDQICVGIDPGKMWMGAPEGPKPRRENGVRYKVLRLAIKISPQELGDTVFAVWAVFMGSRYARKAGRDLSGWAAAIAMAARELSGQPHTLQVNENRRNRAASRALLHRITKENRT